MKNNVFRLTFGTNFGLKFKMNIPRANLNASNVQVIEAMDRIINSNAAMSVNGEPVRRKDARLTITKVREFELTNPMQPVQPLL